MQSNIEGLKASIKELEVGAKTYEKTQADLKERVKELNCLYGLSELLERENITLAKIHQELVEIIPPAWQYPEYTCARLVVSGRTYASERFQRTDWRQSAPVRANGKTAGTLEVCYLVEMPELDEGPFLHEERKLLNILCERLGRIHERYHSESELRKSTSLLVIQKAELERKNTTLQELLLQLEIERNRMESNIQSNVETILVPILDEMRIHGAKVPYVDLLFAGLKDLTSSFSTTLKSLYSILSPRETEICHMVKSGLISKEIGEIMGISSQTVEKHRSRIRRKLGISGEKINLASFLQSM